MAADKIDNSDITNKQSADGDLSSPFSCLFSMQPEQFTLFGVVIALVLAQSLDANEQNTLGNFLALIGQTLMTIAAQAQFLQTSASEASLSVENPVNSDMTKINVQLSEMKKRISELESKL